MKTSTMSTNKLSEIHQEGSNIDKGGSNHKINSNTAITVDYNDNELEENSAVPLEYIFPSFVVYVVYGPFVESSKQLTLLLTGDTAKGETNIRAEKQKAALKEKEASCKDDNKNN